MKKKPVETNVSAELQAAHDRIATLELELETLRGMKAPVNHEQKLNKLLEILPVGVSILDANRKVVFSNPALAQILDITDEGLQHGDYAKRQYLTADGSPMSLKDFASSQSSQSGQAVYNVETGVVKEDGETIWTSVSAVPVDFPDWKMVIVTTDISERKKTEIRLRDTEALYRALFESSLDGLSVFDAKMNVKFSNRRAAEIYGFDSPEAMIGSNALHFIQPDEMPRAVEAARSRRSGSVHYDEFRLRRRDGTGFWGETASIIIRDQADQPSDLVLGMVRDITERKHTEEARLRLVERLDLATRSTGIGIWDWDIQMNELVWSDQMYALYGLEPGKFGGAYEAWLNGVHPEDRDSSNEVSAAALRGEREYNTEFRVLWPDGSTHWLAASGQVFRAEDGTPLRMLGINYEVTERKHAEEKLRESKVRFRSVLDNAQDVIYRVNLQTNRLDYISPSIERVLGYTSAEMMAMDANAGWEMTHPDDIPIMRAGFAHLRETGRAIAEYRQRRKDGEYRWLSNHTSFIKDAAGQPLYRDGSIRDITERKQAELALFESRENFARTFDHNPAAQVVSRKADGKILRINAAYTRMIGYPSEELIGHTAGEINIYADPDQRQEILRRLAETGKVRDYEVSIRVKSGEIRSLIVSIDSIRFEGNDCLLSALLDITERKQMEEDLRRSNAELEQFAYVASHDLQEPLRTVAGMVELLKERYTGKLDDRADTYINHAVDASLRMQKLINDLLEYSRVNRFGKPFESVSMETVLETAIKNLRTAVEESQAIITHDPLPTVNIDPVQITQVLQNLIGNAVKFRSERQLKVHLSAQKTGDVWQFSLRDNGIGIEPRHFERIFVVFQRLHTRRDYPGTGIGLSLCKKIIERHDGKIWLESEPNQGTTFFFTLPEKRHD